MDHGDGDRTEQRAKAEPMMRRLGKLGPFEISQKIKTRRVRLRVRSRTGRRQHRLEPALGLFCKCARHRVSIVRAVKAQLQQVA